jgi:hypothetical protein
MRVGRELLELVRAGAKRCAFVVGTGKNVGKTVTMRAIYEAACDAGMRVGVTSIGRDGEAVDATDAGMKPRLWLRRGTVLATARGVLPSSPASEILELTDLHTAAGTVLLARVAQPGFYELVGPPTASGVRAAVDLLSARTDLTLVDGAVDRIAALAGGDEAIIVACGAAAAPTMAQAVEDAAALVARLSVARFDPRLPVLRIDGAMTSAQAAALIARGETRQVVVRDPTQLAFTGRVAANALSALRIRCERALRVVAVTVASVGRDREPAFEPQAFIRAVAGATGLPAFDVYAGAQSA